MGVWPCLIAGRESVGRLVRTNLTALHEAARREVKATVFTIALMQERVKVEVVKDIARVERVCKVHLEIL